MVTITTKAGHSFWIDDEDVVHLDGHSWYLDQKGYAACHYGGKVRRLHRVLMSPPDGLLVDHIDGNKRNNCRSNLRIVDAAVNTANRTKHQRTNTSGFRGVSWSKVMRGWRAECTIRDARYILGYYQDKVLAAAIAATFRAINMPGARR